MNTLSRTIILLLGLLLLNPASASEMAPAFKIPTAKGMVDLNKLRGQVVYLDFWASWCTPCKKSFPWMNEMHNKYEKQGLKIVAVNLDKKRDVIDRFLKKMPAEFTVAYDPGGQLAKSYKLVGMPSSYLIDRNGELHETHVGFRKKDKDKLEANIQRLLHN